MAKAAMECACRTLGREECQHAVHVNILAPGLMNTEMGARLVQASTNGGSLEDTAATGPFGFGTDLECYWERIWEQNTVKPIRTSETRRDRLDGGTRLTCNYETECI
jgi:NAD(P)-dependent dehydrogenase (short-subunit alcohol dehydrogenase family)